MALTHKQRLFVDEYLGAANGNATRAAERAGYSSPRTQGSRLLTNVDIQAALKAFYAQHSMPAEEILGRLSDQARGAGPYVRTLTLQRDGVTEEDEEHETGVPRTIAVLDLRAMEREGKMHLIKGIKQTEFGQEIQFYDAQSALQLLGRNQRLFIDKTDLAVSGGLKVTSETTILTLDESDADSLAAPAEDTEAGEPGA